MKNYKGKEYLLFLILFSLKLAACNPCVNRTLNAIPYPNDCQAFILCWLSRAYLQTCPNDMFFDVKTNNCQPLVMTSCCNMTVPILVIPIHIYHGSYQRNLTNITDLWPFSYITDKQTNHSSTTSLPPTSKPNTTLVTSVNQSEATKSVISTFKTEVTDSSQTISGFTLNVTEQTIETTSIYINITESTNSTESSQPNIYTSPEIISSTVSDNANSTLVVSTNLTESTSPTTYTFFTELTDSIKTSSRSEITLNVTEIETTTPLATTSKYISTSPPKPSTIPSWSTGTPDSNQTHLTKYPDPITYTFFPAITDSSKSSSPSKITSMVTKIESTTLLSTTVKNIHEIETTEFVKSSPPNVHTTPANISSTEFENKKPKSTLTMSTNQETSTVPSRSTGMPDSSQTHLTESPDPITYTFFPAMTDSSKSSPSEINSNVTEIKTTTSLAITSTSIHKTEATEFIETSASNVYTPPVNVSSTEAESKKPRSTITMSTNPSEASTVPSWWTEMSDTSQTYPTESPDPITYTFFPKITDASKSSTAKITSNVIDIETSTPLTTKIYVTPASLSSTESSSKTSRSTLTISTNPPEVSTVTSWWTGMPDSSQTSLSSIFTSTEPNQVETTTPIQTTNSENLKTEITTEKSRNANDTNLSTTDSSHNTNLVTKTMSITNLSTLSTFRTTLISLNTDTETDETIAPTVEQYTKAKTTIKVGTTVSSKALTTTTDPFHTKSPTITESSTLQPIYSSTPSLPSTSNSSSFPIYFPTDPEWSSTTSQYSDNKSSTESVSGSTDLTTLPSEQTKLITEFLPTTASPTGIETVTTSSTRSSSEIYSTTSADALQTETQIFTESPTLQPLVSSTTKILSSTGSPLHPTIMSTPRNERVSTVTQYSVNETTPVTTVLPTSTPDFKETKAYTLNTITSSSPTGFLPTTVTADPLPTRTQFTESSTLPSIFSSTTNLTYPSSTYPKISSTTKVEMSSTKTQKNENTSPTFASTQEHIREDNISTHVPSSATELITTTEYEQTTTTTQSSPSQIISSTEYITHRPKTTIESSSIIFTDTTENTRWPPITFTWPSPSSSLISTDYTTSKPITTVLSSPSEFNISKNPEYTSTRLSTYPSKFTESSTIIDFFPTHYITSTEDDVQTDESIATVLPSSPTDERRMDPITYTEYVTRNPVTTNKPTSSSLTSIHNSKYTSYEPIATDETSTLIFTTPKYLTSVPNRSTTSHMKPSSSTTTVAEPEIIVTTTKKTEVDPHIERSTLPDRTITSMNTTNLTTSSTSSLSTEKTTMKTVVTVPERTLPPLPYSPPPCVFATTTQKTTKSEKSLSTIPSKSTSSSSTYTTLESSTDSSASRPECRFWDKFTFPDETDCKYYYECLFGDIRRNSCRYGYEFNPYALKCMPHLEANCQRPKSSNGIIDFLYYIMNLNNHNTKDQNEEEENGQDIENELSD